MHSFVSHPLTVGLKFDILFPARAMRSSPFANIPPRLLPSAPGHLWEQFILAGYLRGGLLSLCNTGPLAVRRQIVCIHDVNTRLTPESYGLMFRATYRLLQPALGRCAARIVTVSRFSQKAMAQFGIARAEEIDVIHDGYEHVLDWKPDCSPLNAANLPGPFVLLVGSKAPHKNTAIIYSIAADLAARGIHVLVTGGADANVYAHEHGGQLPPNVRHLGRVTTTISPFLTNTLCAWCFRRRRRSSACRCSKRWRQLGRTRQVGASLRDLFLDAI